MVFGVWRWGKWSLQLTVTHTNCCQLTTNATRSLIIYFIEITANTNTPHLSGLCPHLHCWGLTLAQEVRNCADKHRIELPALPSDKRRRRSCLILGQFTRQHSKCSMLGSTAQCSLNWNQVQWAMSSYNSNSNSNSNSNYSSVRPFRSYKWLWLAKSGQWPQAKRNVWLAWVESKQTKWLFKSYKCAFSSSECLCMCVCRFITLGSVSKSRSIYQTQFWFELFTTTYNFLNIYFWQIDVRLERLWWAESKVVASQLAASAYLWPKSAYGTRQPWPWFGRILIVSLESRKLVSKKKKNKICKNLHGSRVWTRIHPVDSHTQPHRVGCLTRKFVISNSRTCSWSGYEIPQLRSEHISTHRHTLAQMALQLLSHISISVNGQRLFGPLFGPGK